MRRQQAPLLRQGDDLLADFVLVLVPIPPLFQLPLGPQPADEHIVIPAVDGKSPISNDRLFAAAQRQAEPHRVGFRRPAVNVKRFAGQPTAAPEQVFRAGVLHRHVRDPLGKRQAGVQPACQGRGRTHVAGQVEPGPAAGVDQVAQVIGRRLGPLHLDAREDRLARLEPIRRGLLAGRLGLRPGLARSVADVDHQPPPRAAGEVKLPHRLPQAGLEVGLAQAKLVVQPLQPGLIAGLEPALVQRSRGHVRAHQPHAVLRSQARHNVADGPADGL